MKDDRILKQLHYAKQTPGKPSIYFLLQQITNSIGLLVLIDISLLCVTEVNQMVCTRLKHVIVNIF